MDTVNNISRDSGIEPDNNEVIDQSKRFLGGKYHPWRRFFARTVDLGTSGVILSFAFMFFILYLAGEGYLDPDKATSLFVFMENPIGGAIVAYLLWIPIEALFLSTTRTTPAKWIFGIGVVKRNGEKLSFGQSLARAFNVFVKGDGFGISIVLIITRLFAYRRLTKTGTTLWDTSAGSIVTHKKWGVVRAFFSVLSVFSVLAVISILNSMGGTA